MSIQVNMKLSQKQAGKLFMEHEKLKDEFDIADKLINELYESGCLDIQREKMVQDYIQRAI